MDSYEGKEKEDPVTSSRYYSADHKQQTSVRREEGNGLLFHPECWQYCLAKKKAFIGQHDAVLFTEDDPFVSGTVDLGTSKEINGILAESSTETNSHGYI